MNVILVCNRWADSRSLYLNKKHITLLIALFSCLVIAAALGVKSTLQPVPHQTVARSNRMVTSPVMYKQSTLDALAMQLGEMQARVHRLDALGSRLVKLGGMKSSEFQFDKPPAQGGPLVILGSMSAADLKQQLNELSTLVSDRSDKLFTLQTLLRQKQLRKDLRPTAAPIKHGHYSSNFGKRIDPFTGKISMHEGIDFPAVAGTPILASANGVVVYAAKHPQYGNMIQIDHGNGLVTRYAHASKLLVKVGQVVHRGDEIGEVGSTGRSTGNHLHFEVRFKGVAQNPVRFLRRNAG
ncbi:MAG: M23 family metallopeptidase [Gallionella sp.]